jgi:hypothetical protein
MVFQDEIIIDTFKKKSARADNETTSVANVVTGPIRLPAKCT